MDQLRMNEPEQRLYNDLFHLCDADGNGKITGPKASELFVKSGLSHEILHQISDLCGAKRLGYFGRSQFYIALKLIAAVQNGFPVILESIGKSPGVEIPLPKFNRFDARESGRRYPPNATAYSQYVGVPPGVSVRAPQPIKQPSHSYVHQGLPVMEQTPVSPVSSDHTPTSPLAPVPPYNALNKPAATSTAPIQQHSHYNTNSSAAAPNHVEKAWTSFEDENQALVSGASKPPEERHDWTHFTDSSSKADTSSISSESESIEDVWSITAEQREYYINQFRTMQPNLAAAISGPVAKEFFEKSRLPISELAKIWQLSDVNKDGALDLEEFCTAMHLVVLRRNDIELPDQLPLSLLPHVPFNNTEEPFAADLPQSISSKNQSPLSPPTQWVASTSVAESSTSSTVSTPSQKPTPVNFEFKPITADPESRIVQPVAVRLSPESQFQNLDSSTNNFEGDVSLTDDSPVDLLVDVGTRYPKYQSTPQHPRHKPQKAMSIPGPGSIPAPMSYSSQDMVSNYSSTAASHRSRERETHSQATDASGAPVPPPRTKSHSRSSSLDSKQLLGVVEQASGPPVAPRKSKEPMTSTEMSKSLIVTTPVSLEGKISQLPTGASGDQELKPAAKSSAFSQEKTELRAQIKSKKEKNLTLTRLHGELNQELQEVMEQRIALEIQLEHLRPFYGDYI